MAEYITFQPTDYYKTQIYTGTGAENAQTFPQTTAMQPDLTWIKARAGSKSHRLFDSTRGVTKWIASDNTGAESTTAESLKSFDSDGFTLGTYDHVNDNTVAFVSWNWKAGTTSGIAGSPSITPTGYSFNATSGFSIVQYDGNSTSGATVPHGLGVAPKMVIIKCLDAAETWAVGHDSIGWTKYLRLDTTDGATTTDVIFNDTAPTSTLVTLGNNSIVNTHTTDGYIMYCFAEKKGYSKFGSFIGNSNVDGPFIYTGFSPAYVMIKNISTAGGSGLHWQIHSNKQSTFNPNSNMVVADDAAGTATWGTIDLLSNGFKIRTTNYATNYTNQIVYAAFAEFPLVSSNDIPGTAR